MASPSVDASPPAEGVEGLRTLAARSCKRDLRIGVALMPWPLLNDAHYSATAARNFNAVTVEHHMKWAPLLEEDGWAQQVTRLGFASGAKLL